MSRHDFSPEEADQPTDAYPLRHREYTKKRPTHPRWSEFAQGEQPGGAFVTTYRPAQYEEIWLRDSLRDFYTSHFISDVLALVKGGKEATVYRCAAHPRLETPWVAAKIYRPRMFRNLRNDKLYRQGRPILTAEGRAAKDSDQRLMRAIGKKSAFGVQVEHTSWLMYEYTTLERLHQAGAAVPRPIAVAENAILMEYFGDGDRAAPTLNEITLTPEEAPRVFQEVVRNIALMLQLDLIHGDLSAYNILYWEGDITLIDFPQVTACRTNEHAAFILQRDITRICEYFARFGVASDPLAIMEEMWPSDQPLA